MLVSRTSGAEAWAFERVAKTGPDGRVSFPVGPDQRSAYRLAFLGTPLLQPVRSAVVHVAVRPTVTAAATPTVLDPGQTTTVSGAVVTAAGPVVGAPVQLLARRVGSPQGPRGRRYRYDGAPTGASRSPRPRCARSSTGCACCTPRAYRAA